MTTVACPFTECKYNDKGVCLKEVIEMGAAGFSDIFPFCSDYKEEGE
jgi:hypothetical protein